MTTRKVITIGDKILRTKTEDLDPQELQTEEFSLLIDDMIDAMRAENGIGLAAPQVGASKRVFVADTPNGVIAVVNPHIVRRSKKLVRLEEGCLSVPGRFEEVLRSRDVTVRGLTVDGSPIEFTAKGFFARVLQHEIDHLDGILFVDRVEEQKSSAEQ
jgi:peptide deformylase